MQENISLKEKTTFKIGGLARFFWALNQEKALLEAWSVCQEKRLQPLVFGGFSNVLLPDRNLDCVWQITSGQGWNLLTNDRVSVWAGEKMALFSWEMIKLGFQGLENFASLPGTIGGAIWNNAHFERSFLSDIIESVTYLDLQTGKVMTKAQKDLEFAYDQSFFQKNQTVIMSVILRLKKTHQIDLITEKARQTAEKRKETQPLDQPSAGCFWQNPPLNDSLRTLFPQFAQAEKISAGFLIEQAGLKGLQVGGAAISHKHAAFIINLGEATSQDVLELSEQIRNKIEKVFALTLEPEVKIIR